MNREPFTENEFYHVYNRGVDGRGIFSDDFDSFRFLESLKVFNDEAPSGSIYEQSFNKDVALLGGLTPKPKKLVNIVAYCLNPNHFHLILEQISEKGISEFMKRVGGGYTTYFNVREKRKGSLFMGTFKSRHISTNEYLLHVSAYVNLNDRVHQLGGLTPKLIRSSWTEYTGVVEESFCKKDIILGQFKNKEEYKEFAEDALLLMLERKKTEREESYLMIEKFYLGV
ncbi:MAG: transposase [Candidatus Parcubacteria bacterium]|nr:transposase [Candidatus Parcubacteria bacterium]